MKKFIALLIATVGCSNVYATPSLETTSDGKVVESYYISCSSDPLRGCLRRAKVECPLGYNIFTIFSLYHTALSITCK